ELPHDARAPRRRDGAGGRGRDRDVARARGGARGWPGSGGGGGGVAGPPPGVEVGENIIQIRREVDPRTVLGKGKIEELTLRALELGAELILFDRDLSPSQ